MEERYVVSLPELIPPARVEEVAARVAEELRLPLERLEQVLVNRVGPITRAVNREKAVRIADALIKAGVKVEVVREGTPRAMFLTSVRLTRVPETAGDGETGWDSAATARERLGSTASGGSSPIRDREEAIADWRRHGWRKGNRRAPRIVIRRSLMVSILLVSFTLLVVLVQSGTAPGTSGGAVPVIDGFQIGMEAYQQGAFRSARRTWTSLAEEGHPRAQFMLGYMAEAGLGQDWSNAQAAQWYRRAADRGEPEAQYRLALLYQRGTGVPFDQAEAVRWLGRSAEGGFPDAQLALAEALFHGRGAGRDFAAALRWFSLAAQNGVAEAESYLAFFRWQPPAE